MNQEKLLTSLIERGWYVVADFLDQEHCKKLIKELEESPLKEAGVGRGGDFKNLKEIRNDSIFWLSENRSEAQDLYLKKIHELMEIFNRELFLGLKQYEGHFARYDAGGFYKKHLDQFKSNGERKISIITYLNKPASGGELRIYKKENPETIETDIVPIAGSMVCFLSNQIYHEVLPTQDPRYSITGWMRTTIL